MQNINVAIDVIERFAGEMHIEAKNLSVELPFDGAHQNLESSPSFLRAALEGNFGNVKPMILFLQDISETLRGFSWIEYLLAERQEAIAPKFEMPGAAQGDRSFHVVISEACFQKGSHGLGTFRLSH